MTAASHLLYLTQVLKVIWLTFQENISLQTPKSVGINSVKCLFSLVCHNFNSFFLNLILNELLKPLFCFLYHELYYYLSLILILLSLTQIQVLWQLEMSMTVKGHTTCVHMQSVLHYGALQTVFGVNLHSECRNRTHLGLIWHRSLAVGRNEGRCSISASEELAYSTSKQRTVTLKIWTGLLAEQKISLGIRNGTKCGTQKFAAHKWNTHKQQRYFTTIIVF